LKGAGLGGFHREKINFAAAPQELIENKQKYRRTATRDHPKKTRE
jgi:hypothetical protein